MATAAPSARRAEFERLGYAICPFTFDEAVVDAAVSELMAAAETGWATDDGPCRYENAWKMCPTVRDIACDERVLGFLDELMGRPFFPFQTLNFKRGSGQRLHSDFFHFGSSQNQLMAGVWVALEDIHPDSGPLMVVPESQRLPYVFPEDIGLTPGKRGQRYAQYIDYEDYVDKQVAEEGLLSHPMSLRKGEALVWAANLVHGGSPILDPQRTRMSQVTHYYGRGQTYFTPMNSHRSPLRRCYRAPFDITKGRRAWGTMRP